MAGEWCSAASTCTTLSSPATSCRLRFRFLAVEYRRAPEASGSRPVEDMTAALVWLSAHAGELEVDPRRIAVMGDSAGGGLSAGTAILARERGLRASSESARRHVGRDHKLAAANEGRQQGRRSLFRSLRLRSPYFTGRSG